jgi:hypothetical protein
MILKQYITPAQRCRYNPWREWVPNNIFETIIIIAKKLK